MSNLRLIAYGLAGLALIAAGVTVLHWKRNSDRLPLVRQEYEERLSGLNAKLEREREIRRKADESSESFQRRVRDLEDQRLIDTFPAVRLCRSPVVRMPPITAQPGPDAAPIPNDASEAEADPVEVVGVDVGPDLERFGFECEANKIKVEELQAFIVSQ